MGVTGVSMTSSVGSLIPADVVGLTGQSMTSSTGCHWPPSSRTESCAYTVALVARWSAWSKLSRSRDHWKLSMRSLRSSSNLLLTSYGVTQLIATASSVFSPTSCVTPTVLEILSSSDRIASRPSSKTTRWTSFYVLTNAWWMASSASPAAACSLSSPLRTTADVTRMLALCSKLRSRMN